MSEDKYLKEKFGTEGPWKVPEGYFNSLPESIVASLPDTEPEPLTTFSDLSLWQRIKPYVYLAAMFAGIWLMINMFHNLSGVNTLSLDNPPENIAMIVAEHDPSEFFAADNSLFSGSDYELEMLVGSNYDSIEDFEQDFDYEIDPRYDNIKI